MRVLKRHLGLVRVLGRVGLGSGLVMASACAGTEGPNDPVASISRTQSTDNQTAPAGTTLPTSPEVTVLTASGARAPDVTVTFTVGEGGGTVTNGVRQTDSRGTVRVGLWQLGIAAGRNTLIASVGDIKTTFTANGVPGPASLMNIVRGNEQTAPAGTDVPIAPVIKVSDQFGNGVVGVQVTFMVTSGGGSITGASGVLTDAMGEAGPLTWQLGPIPGDNSLDATVAGIGTLTFTATGQ